MTPRARRLTGGFLLAAQLPAEAHGKAINFTSEVKKPATLPTS
jgi:hypothetical protein